jgi:hypothetical protein
MVEYWWNTTSDRCESKLVIDCEPAKELVPLSYTAVWQSKSLNDTDVENMELKVYGPFRSKKYDIYT